jgi:putative DNA primase/helicase
MSMTRRWEAPELRRVQDDAIGRWHTILPALGISDSYLKNRQGPCPMCAGTDRFRFDNKEGLGTWYCNQCGGGDGIKLVSLALHISYVEAAREIAKHISGPPPPKRKEPSQSQRLRAMRETWAGSRHITAADPAGRYLMQRCALSVFPPALRFHPRLGCYTKGEDTSFHPAMIAQVTNAKANAVNIHRTYLTAEGQKAGMIDPKRVMPGELPAGSAIRLTPISIHLGIAEGIETAISCRQLYGIPTWAAISSVGMERWTPPAGVQALTIFADADLSFGGQASAFILARRLVHDKWPGEISVRLPAECPQDFNDIHRLQLDRRR